MDKRKIFEKYNNFNTNVGMGSSIINFVKQFLPYEHIIQEAALMQIVVIGMHTWLPWFNIPFAFVILFVVVKYYGFLVAQYFVGRFMHWWGFWKYGSEYMAKKEHISPFNDELKEQLREHSRVINEVATFLKLDVRAEDKFKDL